MQRLRNKVAIVTAATEGIGYAIAERLGKEGARVSISSRKQRNVDRAVNDLKRQGIEVIGRVCHVGKREDRDALIEHTVSAFGGIDILVSNAAVNPVYGPMLEVLTEEAWDKIFDINVKASFFLAKSAFPHMKNRNHKNGEFWALTSRGASIIMVSSLSALQPDASLGAYATSKTAMIGLVKNMSIECARHGIRVNGLLPGLIKTSFSKALWDRNGMENFIKETIPIGRIGDPADCGGAAAFLASDDAAFVTGENLVAAGGQTSRL